jgi:hypothetical protein
MKYYSGIGSTHTPSNVIRKFTEIASKLNFRGWILRSGGADGADTAFEIGATENKDIYLPWRGFNSSGSNLILENPIPEKIIEVAKSLYVRWDFVTDGVKRLHARNVYQILGHSLTMPSEFVICWTDRPSNDTGGTMFGVTLAKKYNIPVYNFYNFTDEVRFNKEILGE